MDLAATRKIRLVSYGQFHRLQSEFFENKYTAIPGFVAAEYNKFHHQFRLYKTHREKIPTFEHLRGNGLEQRN
jgi:hypothetical protein